MKGIFDTKADSGYDDEITRRYEFPSQYRSIAKELVGCWIIYREPQRNRGRRAYIAVARITHIEHDESRPGRSYARLADFLSFDEPVPFSNGSTYAESALRQITDPKRVGIYLQGRSIRPISESDFAAIVRQGLSATLESTNAHWLELDPASVDGKTQDLLNAPLVIQERRIEEILLNRKVRDANFRRSVCHAYKDTCAVTRLCIVNERGNAEAEAAHIWPVALGGPDVVRNGIALSRTAHWLFDRHLISLNDDYSLLVSKNEVPAELRKLFVNQMARIHLPDDKRLWPHPDYIAKHRKSFSGG